MMKVFAVSCLLALAGAAPKPEAEADPQFLAAAPYAAAVAAPAVVPAANCKTDTEILVTQSCAPSAENVCTKQTVDTEEIEYEKVCKEVVDTICDAPAAIGYHAIAKREADAKADSQSLLLLHTLFSATISMRAMKSPLNTGLTTLRSSLSPLRLHCHTVTKVTYTDVEIPLSNTTCELVLRNCQSSYQTNHSQIHRRQGPQKTIGHQGYP